MKVFFSAFLFLILLIGMDACSPKPFHSANKQYRQQTKEFAKLIREEPMDPVNDTIRQPDYFVG
ncbi:MAG: hypothetical protein KGO92_10780, partial [Bacteroidota bacterium]|nr:hypothetical protein [Bacteroidota bacterium]